MRSASQGSCRSGVSVTGKVLSSVAAPRKASLMTVAELLDRAFPTDSPALLPQIELDHDIRDRRVLDSELVTPFCEILSGVELTPLRG